MQSMAAGSQKDAQKASGSNKQAIEDASKQNWGNHHPKGKKFNTIMPILVLLNQPILILEVISVLTIIRVMFDGQVIADKVITQVIVLLVAIGLMRLDDQVDHPLCSHAETVI